MTQGNEAPGVCGCPGCRREAVVRGFCDDCDEAPFHLHCSACEGVTRANPSRPPATCESCGEPLVPWPPPPEPDAARPAALAPPPATGSPEDPPHDLPALIRLSAHQRGLVLVGGPRGGGRPDTAALLLGFAAISHPGCVFVVGRQPRIPERAAQLVVRREVGRDAPSLQAVVETAVRFVPDVAYLGVLADADSLEAAIGLAEAGSLVIVEIPCETVVHTREWLLDRYPPSRREEMRQRFGRGVAGIVCQVPVPLADGRGSVPATETLELMGPSPLRTVFGGSLSGSQLRAALMSSPSRFGFVSRNVSLVTLAMSGGITSHAALDSSDQPAELRAMLARSVADSQNDRRPPG